MFSSILIHSAIVLGVCNGNQILEYLLPKNYSTLRPLNGSVIDFDWSLRPHRISELSATKMEFSVDLTISCFWVDTELNITSENLITLPSSIGNQLWYPWVRFENCVGCANEVINGKDTQFILQSKTIGIQHRTTFKFTCVLDLSRYPFDKQICYIQIKFIIWHGPVNVVEKSEEEYYKKLQLHNILVPPEYDLDSVIKVAKICNKKKKNDRDKCFKYIFTLKRIPLQHVLLVFLPSMLIVTLSWISFWLDVEMAAPRVALGLTSLLTLATQFNSAQRNLPPVATIKALDIWMFMSMFMVFASMIIYALSYTCNRYKKLHDIVQTNEKSIKPKRKNLLMITNRKKIEKYLKLFNFFKFKHIDVDKMARVIFPLAFLIFNIYFWSTYL